MAKMQTRLKILLLVGFTYWSSCSAKKTPASDRSYHLGVPLINSAQGLHFYSSGSPGLVYPSINVPATVYVPGQIGVLNLPAGLSQPTSSVNHPTESTPSYAPTYSPPRPSYTPYGQQHSSASFSIEQSVDLSDSTPPSPVPSTYGPPKSVELQFRRPHVHRTYHRPKGHSHSSRGSRPPSGRPLYYSHMHKGHYHTHYIGPSSPSSPPSSSHYKPQRPTYFSPTPPPSTTASPNTEVPPPLYNPHAHPPTESPNSLYNHHAHPVGPPSGSASSSLVRFPDSPSHAELTQAVLGQPGVINNYDANLPLKIPKPKPNQLEVKEILKNADLHFVDVLEHLPSTTVSPLNNPGQPAHVPGYPSQYPGVNIYEQRYPISQFYAPAQQAEGQQQNADYAAYLQSNKPIFQSYRPYAELYDQRFQVSPSFISNHLEQDNSKSESVKIPVAVFKGVVPTMFPMNVKRSDTIPSASEQTKTTDFVPSKSTSDWIPVTGVVKPERVRNLNQFGDDYFSDMHREKDAVKHSKKSIEPETFHPSTSQKFSAPKAEQIVGSSLVFGNSQSGSPMGISFFDSQSASSAPGSFFPSRPEEDSQEGVIQGTSYFGSQSGSSGPGGSFKDYAPKPLESNKGEKVGDIISGRIPGDHNPFAVIGGEVKGTRDRRVGNLPDNPSSVATANIGDSSNLVVSSVIKFSR